MPQWNAWLYGRDVYAQAAVRGRAWTWALALLQLLDCMLRGFSQTLYVNNPLSGLLVVAALAVEDGVREGEVPVSWLTGAAWVGGLASTLGAVAAGLEPAVVRAGLFSATGIGVAVGVASAATGLRSLRGVALLVFCGAAQNLVSLGFAHVARRFDTPAFDLPLDFSRILVLLLLHTSPHFAVRSAAASAAETAPLYDARLVYEGTLNGLSAALFCSHVASGWLLLCALALYSPAVAAWRLLGSLVGTLVACGLSRNAAPVRRGLLSWGSGLAASLVAAVALWPSRQSALLALCAALAAAWLAPAAQQLLRVWSLPPLAFHASLVAMLFLAARKTVAGLEDAFVLV
jgi:urea transporter